MIENEVFWLGGRSRSGGERKNFADEQEFVVAMQNACEDHGCKVQRFVSARGVYGTWLLEFARDGQDQRIVWNGKEDRLMLQVALANGGWEEPNATSIGSMDVQGFIEGIRVLIGRNADPAV